MNGTIPMLHGPETLRLKPHHDQTLHVERGLAYVTTDGDLEDHFVAAGEDITLPGHHLTVVQGWPDALVTMH